MAWDLKKVFHLIAPLLYSTPSIEMYKLQNTITALPEIFLFLSSQKCYICNERYNSGNEKCFSGSRSIDRNKYTVLTRKTQGKDNNARSWKKAFIIRKYFYAFWISVVLMFLLNLLGVYPITISKYSIFTIKVTANLLSCIILSLKMKPIFWIILRILRSF